jgi:arabinofuranan 3-O-arabinosyltransferase
VRSLLRRPATWAISLLAALAYLPALTAAPGRMPSDSKLYLSLDPARLIGDAASTFDPRQYAGWVPHQHVAYLWPAGPWFWSFDTIGVPDWIAHRLWIGTLMVAAGLGVRWTARLLGLGQAAALSAAVVYQLSPYLLPYVSRTSVMLLPWAGLGWIVGFTIRATRRRTWGDPAAIALVVLTVGAVNVTALSMIVPAPVLWLIHTVWQRSISWRQAALVGMRVVALTVPVSMWWMVMLLVQGASGAEVLPYSESLADVSLTATAPEVWRGLGYWLFYVRDAYAATTTESLRYLSSTPAIFVSYALPVACLAGLLFVRWAHRRFAALLVVAGAVLAVGVHPIGDRAPLMRLLAGDDETGLALALRSSTRALPVMALGLSLLAGSLVAAASEWRPTLRRPGWRTDVAVCAAFTALAVANLPALWTGGFVDPALERDQDPPAAWVDAAAALDRSGAHGRVLQIPGAEFGAYRWGYTVDQPLPGLTDKPLVTRDLLPLGSPGAMDLLYALDDRIQDGVFEPASLAPLARWLGVDTLWLTNDLAYDRFRTARPRVLGAAVDAAPGIGEVTHFGPPQGDHPAVAMTDEQSLGDPAAGAPASAVDLYPVEQPGAIVRAGDQSVVVSGSGDGLVDAGAAGLLTGDEVVRYSASLDTDELERLDRTTALIVTDSNRDRARHWRSSQDTTGYTESDQPELELLREVASDQRLPLFDERDAAVDPATQTIARQVGPVTATATSYGEPFAYLPERRPYMAIDGDLHTAWTVGEHADPIGETLRLHFDAPVPSLSLVQHDSGGRRITSIRLADPSRSDSVGAVELDDRSLTVEGQRVELPAGSHTVDITITAVGGGLPNTPGAVAGVGFAEVITGAGPTLELVRPPHDALSIVGDEVPLSLEFTRQRVQPTDRWRSDPETALIRQFELTGARRFEPGVEVRIDQRAGDQALAEMFGWPAWASTRLTGSVRNAGIAALDGDDATSWITAFGEAVGATLTIGSLDHGVERISVRQPVGTFSRVTEVVLRSAGQERTVQLQPDAAGRAVAEIDPPLPGGTVEIVLSGVEPSTTIDRRYADVVELPAAISEITLGDAAISAPVEATRLEVDCTPLLSIDGAEHQFRFTVDGAAITTGAAIVAEPCDWPSQLSAGTHIAAAAGSALPVDVDRLVLAGPSADAQGAGTGYEPVATVRGNDRFHRTIEVSACTRGCWLVFGEGFSPDWEASIDGRDLGEPLLVDGGFNGWRIEPTEATIEIDVRWTEQRKLDLAIAVSALGALIALVLLVRDRRRPQHPASEPAGDPGDPPALGSDRAPRSRRHALVTGVAWAVLAGLLIAPAWAGLGALGGLAVVIWRRMRVAELVAVATLIAVAGCVIVRERRNAPAPNGAWPSVFESWHRLAMFAVVAVAAAAIGAADSDLLDEQGDRRLAGDEGDESG